MKATKVSVEEVRFRCSVCRKDYSDQQDAELCCSLEDLRILIDIYEGYLAHPNWMRANMRLKRHYEEVLERTKLRMTFVKSLQGEKQ